jgi:hypothetical protein
MTRDGSKNFEKWGLAPKKMGGENPKKKQKKPKKKKNQTNKKHHVFWL